MAKISGGPSQPHAQRKKTRRKKKRREGPPPLGARLRKKKKRHISVPRGSSPKAHEMGKLSFPVGCVWGGG